MKLYEFGLTRSYKVRWLINELGIECEYVNVHLGKGEHLTEEFLKINPFGKVPVLDDGEVVIHEASAICNYLCEKHSDKNLIPKSGTKERAYFDMWNFFASNELECHLWTCEKHTWGYPEDKRSPVAIEMASSDFMKAAKVVDQHLQKNEFMMGAEFSVLDINYAYLLRWARGRKLLGDFPRLLDYLNTQIERKHYPKELFKS